MVYNCGNPDHHGWRNWKIPIPRFDMIDLRSEAKIKWKKMSNEKGKSSITERRTDMDT